ncbi:Predicted 5' DNA nuclease, flap endonuclease-1-like, helix-3-turn-helix (H3TH) domain [Paracoccus saliphilus]|uniref:Predicted 5' DNA nuclease, flap endonuclease-1-like, helix-3-turn-helix (H3TH) domain n=3 Tax=Paracoccus saliphilus TaxID=405559 RepID=A0AA45W1U0_9RHOB|nr:Predicted 5' DNA nuclease, flap endonuclease-1-like, helix-3-turn-helix (H3TH) domain [Paracoccus saliphilus]
MPTANCTRNCWIAGAGLGFLVWIITAGIGPLRWFEGLFLGLIAAVLMGRFLIWLLCDGMPAETEEERRPLSSPAAEGAQHSDGGATAVGLMGSGAARSMSGQNDIYGGASGDKPVDRKSIVAGAPAKTEKAQPDAKPVKTNKAQADAKPASAKKPAKAAPKDHGKVDDLKEIKGVGPKLEGLLREHGVTRFSQIAEWGEDEMDHFAELIGRMGSRIRSDDWVGQARTLAQGGETEFSKRVGKGDVY